jgi:hypothetical protein
MKRKSPIDPNWRFILRRAWSAWLIAVALVLTTAEIAAPLLLPGVVSEGTFAILSALASVGALIARVLVQQDFRNDDS